MPKGGGPPAISTSQRRAGLLLTAVIVGAAAPWGAFAVAVRLGTHLSRACSATPLTVAEAAGQVLYSTGPSLILARADLTHPVKLVDYSSRVTAPPPPASAASPAATPTPDAAVSPPPQGPAGARVAAAAISSDRRLVAYLVDNPPDAPTAASLRIVSTAPGGSVPVEAWSGDYQPGGRAEVSWLSATTILFRVPYQFGLAEPSVRLVGVASTAPKPQVVQAAPEAQFVASFHASWPETSALVLPPLAPQVADRVDGPGGAVAGRHDVRLNAPFSHRSVHEVLVGRAGATEMRAVCSTRDNLVPERFSPDARQLALSGPTGTFLVAAAGGRGVTRLIHGRLLDWVAAAPAPPS